LLKGNGWLLYSAYLMLNPVSELLSQYTFGYKKKAGQSVKKMQQAHMIALLK